MRNPPKDTSYETIKKALIEAFATTQLEKDTKLLGMFTLGDRDPRSFIRELRALNEEPETLLRAIVINALPQEVRTALGSMPPDATLEQLGEHAFKILDLRRERKGIHAVKRQPPRQEEDSEEEDANVNAVHSRSFQRSGKGGHKPRGDASGDGPFVCFAHKKFGPKAFSCKPGCSFAELPLAKRGAGNGPAGR